MRRLTCRHVAPNSGSVTICWVEMKALPVTKNPSVQVLRKFSRFGPDLELKGEVGM